MGNADYHTRKNFLSLPLWISNCTEWLEQIKLSLNTAQQQQQLAFSPACPHSLHPCCPLVQPTRACPVFVRWIQASWPHSRRCTRSGDTIIRRSGLRVQVIYCMLSDVAFAICVFCGILRLSKHNPPLCKMDRGVSKLLLWNLLRSQDEPNKEKQERKG